MGGRGIGTLNYYYQRSASTIVIVSQWLGTISGVSKFSPFFFFRSIRTFYKDRKLQNSARVGAVDQVQSLETRLARHFYFRLRYTYCIIKSTYFAKIPQLAFTYRESSLRLRFFTCGSRSKDSFLSLLRHSRDTLSSTRRYVIRLKNRFVNYNDGETIVVMEKYNESLLGKQQIRV